MRFRLLAVLVGFLGLQVAGGRTVRAQQPAAKIRVSVTIVAAPIAPHASDSLVAVAKTDLAPRLLRTGVRLTVADLPASASPGRPVVAGAPRPAAVGTRRIAIEYVGS
jgi:hypothetical protein